MKVRRIQADDTLEELVDRLRRSIRNECHGARIGSDGAALESFYCFYASPTMGDLTPPISLERG
jgi:hypothetical protein